MQKISRGRSFRPTLNYVVGRGDKQGAPAGEIIGGNMSGESVDELVREYVAAARQRPDVEKPVWHNSLRHPLDKPLDRNFWLRYLEEYMRRMGFLNTHPYCVGLHPDENAVHIVASRVSFCGRVGVVPLAVEP
jgi:hypothetical protein